MTEPPILDDVNKRIIEQLQHDGRMSYATLAKKIGLSEAAARQRVQRMLDSGVMQIVAVTDPLTLGFHRQVMIGMKVEGDMRVVADEDRQDPRSRLRSDLRRFLRRAGRTCLRG